MGKHFSTGDMSTYDEADLTVRGPARALIEYPFRACHFLLKGKPFANSIYGCLHKGTYRLR